MNTWETLIFKYINKKKDEECCGLLAKQGDKTVFFPCKNYAEDKSNNFLISYIFLSLINRLLISFLQSNKSGFIDIIFGGIFLFDADL